MDKQSCWFRWMAGSVCLLLVSIPVLAGPSHAITRPNPVTGPPNTGPLHDPDANLGQWFQDGQVRSHEFYDNIQSDGGGLAGHLAIRGQAVNILDPTGAPWMPGMGIPIGAFDVLATVDNTLHPNMETNYQPGDNMHGEMQAAGMFSYVGTLYDARITAEFAEDPMMGQPQGAPNPPYRPSFPAIQSMNHDTTAWYCFNQNEQEPLNVGNFWVPTWNLGNIPIGGTAQVVMQFVVPGLIIPSDPRYAVIEGSFVDPSLDILMNRTTSLKISTWVDDLGVDNGGAYPHLQGEEGALRSSDVSVFHNIPEPGSLLLLLGGAIGVLAWRRTRAHG